MRLVIQRVRNANILIDDLIEKSMEKGLLVYLGISKQDDGTNIEIAIDKILKLRFFENEEKKLKKNIVDIDGSILIVSNFTLYAKTDKGTTLSFDNSANFSQAKPIYDEFISKLQKAHSKLITGEFGSDMQITSQADGPVNVVIDI